MGPTLMPLAPPGLPEIHLAPPGLPEVHLAPPGLLEVTEAVPPPPAPIAPLRYSPPSHASEKLPSVGAALHGTGMCKPCGWFHKEGGCRNGQECRHCHLCPASEFKARKKDK